MYRSTIIVSCLVLIVLCSVNKMAAILKTLSTCVKKAELFLGLAFTFVVVSQVMTTTSYVNLSFHKDIWTSATDYYIYFVLNCAISIYTYTSVNI